MVTKLTDALTDVATGKKIHDLTSNITASSPGYDITGSVLDPNRTSPTDALNMDPTTPTQPTMPTVGGGWGMPPQGYAVWNSGMGAQLIPTELTPWEEAQMELELRKQGFNEWQIRQQIEEVKAQRMQEWQKFQQQMGFEREQYDWQKEIDEANMQLAKLKEQRAKRDQEVSEWERYVNAIVNIPRTKYLQAGLATGGNLPSPEQWQKNLGGDYGRAMEQWGKGKDWASNINLQRPGIQAQAQMPTDQLAKTQNIFEWQGKGTPSANTAGYFSSAPTLSKRW